MTRLHLGFHLNCFGFHQTGLASSPSPSCSRPTLLPPGSTVGHDGVNHLAEVSGVFVPGSPGQHQPVGSQLPLTLAQTSLTAPPLQWGHPGPLLPSSRSSLKYLLHLQVFFPHHNVINSRRDLKARHLSDSDVCPARCGFCRARSSQEVTEGRGHLLQYRRL